jgi:tetratricopeptide (TPR) repeat protein
MTQFFSRHRRVVLCLLLAITTLALYLPATRHDFINVDDPRFVYQNPQVQAGITWAGVGWAFHSFETENWQPLTWLSHMLDCQLYGLHPGGHHLTSVLFHVANSLLLFLWLYGLTQATWRSAFVAAFFAWHPLHVESVAWVCERKDVLSTFFWLLALLAYTRYAQASPFPARNNTVAPRPARRQAALFYALTLLCFACGLMSKPMVVTLPCVLLLLDYWPLNRFGFLAAKSVTPGSPLRTAAWLAAEKLPFLLLTLGMSIATVAAQKAGGALASFQGLPLSARLANSLANYLIYLGKTFWPSGLAYFYPYDFALPAALVLASVLLLLICTAGFVWRARREPYLLVGWLWFLGTLIPVIGLVHVGIQARADRYMYIPSIGLFIAVVWGVPGLFQRWAAGRDLPLALGGLALAGCFIVTSIQLTYWQDSATLSTHAIEVTRDNYVAYESLGRALYAEGNKTKAYACYAQSIKLEPDFPQSQYNFALVLREFGHLPEAADHFATTVKLVPDRYEARTALGSTLLLMNGRLDDAATQFAAAVRLQPDSAEAHHGLALALARQGKITNALPEFAAAVRLAPTDANMRFDLGLTLLNTQKPAAAAAEFTAELQLAPNETRAHYRLAQALEQQNQFAAAAAHYQAALNLATNFPEAAAALARIRSAHPELPPREPLDIPR